ncbi:hypothetical protein PtA15_16A372 [Puccinia triticina]|uniref:Uncharacterized protein n=1 Tax=Puccinia triticina TaxID=208348 RepID=A0ABY7D4C1_9BASI|nr:uncharacterized protein PtA15_16A372 [Puccinia triticina]WAQ92464.1 hypothetical protein PtA15_16A372 [Puccinia triticina]
MAPPDKQDQEKAQGPVPWAGFWRAMRGPASARCVLQCAGKILPSPGPKASPRLPQAREPQACPPYLPPHLGARRSGGAYRPAGAPPPKRRAGRATAAKSGPTHAAHTKAVPGHPPETHRGLARSARRSKEPSPRSSAAGVSLRAGQRAVPAAGRPRSEPGG